MHTNFYVIVLASLSLKQNGRLECVLVTYSEEITNVRTIQVNMF